MIFRIFLAMFAASCLAACTFIKVPHDAEAVFPDPEAYAVSDRVVGYIHARDFDGFLATLPPAVEEHPDVRDDLKKIFDALPEGDLEISRFYAERRVGEGDYSGVPIYMSVYDVAGDKEFGQLTLAVYPEDDVCCLTSYTTLIPTTRRPSTYNALNFEGKGWVHYVIFTLIYAVPVFMVAMAVLCFVEKKVRHRWLWIMFILVGLWGVHFNWTTGALNAEFFESGPGGVTFKFLQLHLLGVGITTSGPFHPWIIVIGSPVGAVAYLFRRGLRKPPADPRKPYETPA